MPFKVFPKGCCGLTYVPGSGHKDDPRRPGVPAGNPAEAGNIINGLRFRNPFTSMVLSYEKEPTTVEIQRDMERFWSRVDARP
jgi:hypothetical protein